MEKLPQELLREVLQYLQRTDLPSVRLVNRKLATGAEPFLFHTIPLWIESESLEALTGIAEHPQLSQYVKQIIFSPSRYIEHEDQSLYQAGVRDGLEYQSASLSSNIPHLGHHMAAYDSFLTGQQYLASKSADVKILSHAFGKLPQFKSLVVDYESMSAYIQLYKTFGQHEYEPELVACDGEYGFPVLFKALANSKVAISTFTIGDSQALDTWYVPATGRDRFRSTRSSQAYHTERTTSVALWKTFSRTNALDFRETLRNLRRFEMSRIKTESLLQDDVDCIILGIGTILRWSSHIESIEIARFGVNDTNDVEMPLMADLFPKGGLKKLQRLRLEEFSTTLSYLLFFFRRCGRRLREIEFDYVNISDADWTTALLRLRAMEFPALVRFRLDRVMGVIGTIEACDYITGANDIHPIRVA